MRGEWEDAIDLIEREGLEEARRIATLAPLAPTSESVRSERSRRKARARLRRFRARLRARVHGERRYAHLCYECGSKFRGATKAQNLCPECARKLGTNRLLPVPKNHRCVGTQAGEPCGKRVLGRNRRCPDCKRTIASEARATSRLYNRGALALGGARVTGLPRPNAALTRAYTKLIRDLASYAKHPAPEAEESERDAKAEAAYETERVRARR